ncbi:MAG: hypothetical protein GX332_10640 [Alcaligenaceae bacterium]|nr:hypothetical protein [Alcaligenaceae bacterium]
MKTKKMLLLFTAIILLLTACTGDNKPNTNTDLEEKHEDVDTDKTMEESENEKSEIVEGAIGKRTNNIHEIHEFNEVVADNDDFKATLTSIEYAEFASSATTKDIRAYMEITFAIDNKKDETMGLSAMEVSLNGREFERFEFTSNDGIKTDHTVAAGKSNNFVIDITDYSKENKLPELGGDLDVKLSMFTSESSDNLYDIHINLD